LIEAAERRVADDGLAGLRARDLAKDVGVALGAIYNLVTDIDELISCVNARTLERLDAILAEAAAGPSPETPTQGTERLLRIARAYRAFAAEHRALWRALFEHRWPEGRPLSERNSNVRQRMLQHALASLRAVAPAADDRDILTMARALTGATHGVVALALDDRGATRDEHDGQIEWLVRSACAGAREDRGAVATCAEPA
jgi:AcrR family transcriptional regulator